MKQPGQYGFEKSTTVYCQRDVMMLPVRHTYTYTATHRYTDTYTDTHTHIDIYTNTHRHTIVPSVFTTHCLLIPAPLPSPRDPPPLCHGSYSAPQLPPKGKTNFLCLASESPATALGGWQPCFFSSLIHSPEVSTSAPAHRPLSTTNLLESPTYQKSSHPALLSSLALLPQGGLVP